MKRQDIKRFPLADSVIAALEAEAKTYRVRDSDGLYLNVTSSGTKSWLLRYKSLNGKWAWMGLGAYPDVSGKFAREKARELLAKVRDGTDIRSDNAKREAMLFDAMAERWLDRKIAAGRAPGTTRQMRLYLDSDILPVLTGKPIDRVTRKDCTLIQQRLELRKAHNMAKKVRSWLNQIFSLAIAEEHCEYNPASELKHVAEKGPPTKHYPYLLENELQAFLEALRDSNSRKPTTILIRLVLNTACRPGMARLARWDEIDFEKALWTIPAKRMKMRREHLIPLSSQVLLMLDELRAITGRSVYLFPGNGSENSTLSENTLNRALSLIGYKDRLVGHGSRHTASTILREHGWPRDIVEHHLSHFETGVAGVYNKAEYLPQRRVMMQWYSDALAALENGDSPPLIPAEIRS